jgi:hypothetical protein
MTGRNALALLFVCLLCGRAQAHGPEQWIADENLHDPASGLFCCGPNDCKPLKRGDVKDQDQDQDQDQDDYGGDFGGDDTDYT